MLYNQGWKLGARVGPLPKDMRAQDADFQQGYKDGREAYGHAMSAAAANYGHERSILRVQEGGGDDAQA